MFQEEVVDLRDYVNIVRRRMWLILLVLAVFMGAGLLFTLNQTPVYKATTRLLLEKETPKVLSFQEVLNEDTRALDYSQTQYKLLKSDSLARQVLEKLNMFERSVEPEAESGNFSLGAVIVDILHFLRLREPPVVLSESERTAAKERKVIRNFLKKIAIIPERGSRLVDIEVTSHDRKETARIANTLAETFIEQNLEIRLTASKKAVRWLTKELETSWDKVSDSEAALQRYKEEHSIISFEDRQNIVMQKLLQLNAAVTKTRINRIAAEAQYLKIQDYLHSKNKEHVQSIPQIIQNQMIQQLKVELSKLESEYSELQKKFRAKHPTIIALRSQISSIRRQIEAEIRRIFMSIQSEYEVLQAQERDLAQAVEAQKEEALELNQKAFMCEVLQREVQSNRLIHESLLQRAKEASVSERLEVNNIRIVDRAGMPDAPVAPKKISNMFFAMALGLLSGVVLSFFLEYWDDSIKTPEDIKYSADMPFLGIIPKVLPTAALVGRTNCAVDASCPANALVVDPSALVSEAYRSLRTSVMISTLQYGSVLLVTSAEPAEGKSSIVASLGIAIALCGRKVLILDCDFRKPVIHQMFHVKNTNGGLPRMIADFGSNGTHIVVKRTHIPNLDILPCGKIPSNPAEILESENTKILIEALSKKYETILIDSPPINVVTDPVILSRIASGVIFVIHSGQTTRDAVQCAQEQLRDAGATIIGGVLNDVDLRKDSSYYGYRYTRARAYAHHARKRYPDAA